jgi:hypothetical protein
MNKGILGFPRNAALQAKSVTAQTVNAGTVSAQTVSASTLAAISVVKTAGSSATNTGIKLVNDADLGTLFRPASYTAVETVSVSPSGSFGSGNCSVSLAGSSVTGNQLNLQVVSNCNCACVCACSTDSNN